MILPVYLRGDSIGLSKLTGEVVAIIKPAFIGDLGYGQAAMFQQAACSLQAERQHISNRRHLIIRAKDPITEILDLPAISSSVSGSR